MPKYRSGQRYFEDVEPGDEHNTSWTPTSESVIAYMGVSTLEWTTERLEGGYGRFTDPEAARRLGLPGPIVPGVFSLSVLTRIVNDWTGMDGRIRVVEVNFRRPVQHDAELTAMALVTDTEKAADEPGMGRVKLDIFLENENGERPVQGVSIVDLPLRP